MSAFKVGDRVRVTFANHSMFDRVGEVIEIFDQDVLEPAVYRVRFGGATVKRLCERDLTIADPDVADVLDQMDAESALPQADLAPHLTAIKKSQAEWDAMVTPDPVSAPSHYRSHPSGIETIQITRHESFLRGNILKYVLRAPYKGSELQDLRKAAQYLQWEIARAEDAS